MKKSVQSTVVLVAICAVMAVLLALTNFITAPIIKQNQDAAANQALLVVMPDGEGFEKVDISSYTLPSTVTEVYKESKGGYVVTLTTAGYGSGLVIMCGVSPDGTVTGAVCLASTETLGHEKTFGENFIGKDAAGVGDIDTISGATKTTAAYKNAIKDALNTAIILGGGEADLRTEEEILNDNLSAALPAGEGKFTRLFISDLAEGIDAVYVADNGKGYVFVMGEEFIPVDENGNTDNEIVKAAYDAIVDSKIDISEFELPSTVTEVYKGTNGGYVITLTTEGFGEGFVIKCTVSAEGIVTDVVCLASSETLGHEKTFGENFIGKDATGVDAVDTISKATLTTTAYKNAVKDALNAAVILGGGEADLRTPEEIFADNLKEALPSAEGEFIKQAIADKDAQIDFIYAAKNGTGYVYVIGEDIFIGVDAEGNTTATGYDDATIELAKAKASLAASHTKVDTTDSGINKNITSVQKTEEGNYVIEVNGLGFAYFGDESHYMPGKNIPIQICVVISPEGVMLECLTVAHQESNGFGAVCGEESYYGQFDGKTESDYKEVDAIGGATITTSGYMKAIERAFAAVKILEGGEN